MNPAAAEFLPPSCSPAPAPIPGPAGKWAPNGGRQYGPGPTRGKAAPYPMPRPIGTLNAGASSFIPSPMHPKGNMGGIPFSATPPNQIPLPSHQRPGIPSAYPDGHHGEPPLAHMNSNSGPAYPPQMYPGHNPSPMVPPMGGDSYTSTPIPNRGGLSPSTAYHGSGLDNSPGMPVRMPGNAGPAGAPVQNSTPFTQAKLTGEGEKGTPGGDTLLGESGESITTANATTVVPPSELREDVLPVATPVSFAESRLPKLFECLDTKTAPPATPMKLSTAWQLYADDHQTLLQKLLTATNHSSNPNGNGVNNGGESLNGTEPHSAGDSTQIVFDPVFISTVTNLEEFWRLWRFVTPPSASSVPFTYSFFRENITPDWEHPRNRRGGTMSLYIYDRDKTGLNDRQNFDDAFQAVLLGCVGECFSDSTTTVNGVMLKLRQSKPVALQIWTAHGDINKLRNFVKSLRETLTPILGEKPLQKIEFFLHPSKQPPKNSLASRLIQKSSGPDLVL